MATKYVSQANLAAYDDAAQARERTFNSQTYEPQVAGKHLSTNDYTNDEKTKLSGIAAGAQVNAIETISVNGTAQSIDAKGVDISVPTNTNQLTNGADFATNTQVGTAIGTALEDYTDTEGMNTAIGNAVSAAISAVYKPAGDVANVAALPALSASVLGNVYNLQAAGTTTADFVSGAGNKIPAGANIVVVDTGTAETPVYKFDVLSGFVDLSEYAKTADFEALTAEEIATIVNGTVSA